METYRHLSRKVQHKLGEQSFPSDLLLPSAVATKFVGHVGLPAELADSIAYEPVQSLLAVGTQDGRVKIIGRPGVEVTLRSTSRSPTKYLGFLKNKGAVLRVTQDGDIQLFSIAEKRLLTSTWLQGDTINTVALLPEDPYLLLGCESGNVRVVSLLDSLGRPAEGARQAADLSLQPYQVLAEDLDAKGPVVSLDVTSLRGRPLLVVVHKHSGALVWDIRAEKLVCAALDDENEVSKPTSVCWVGERANCFAVGYDDGSILLYGVPQSTLQEDPLKVSAPADAQLLMTFRVAAPRARAGAIKALSFVAGEKGDDWLLVLGGQALEEPDMLTKLPLAARAQGQAIPWFGTIKGHALVPGKGSLNAHDNPVAVMVLTEGGQLVIHDLASWQPVPLTLPFQELSPISVAKVVPTVSLGLLGLAGDGADAPQPSPGGTVYSGRSGGPASSRVPAEAVPRPAVQHALTLAKLRRAGRGSGSGAAAAAWPLFGGEAAARWGAGPGEAAAAGGRHPSALYFTGHRDGRVRVWDATSCVPALLLAMPAAAGQERLRPATALEVCSFSGIVLVGHQGGEVRLYQFSDAQQTVHRMNVDESGVPYDNVSVQPPGFQYVMRYGIHTADITAVCLATKLKLAAVADESGAVSVLDLMQPALLWTTRALPRPVRHLAVGCHMVPSQRDREKVGAEQPSGPGTERLVLFVAGDDSTLLMLTLEKGELLGKLLKPKNSSRPLAMVLLDDNGTVMAAPHGAMTFPWANNNAAGAAPAGSEPEEEGDEVLSLSPQQQMRRLSLGLDCSASLSPRGSLPTKKGGSGGGPASSAATSSRVAGLPSRAVSTEPPAESSTGDSLELRELPSDEEPEAQPHAAPAAPTPGMTETAVKANGRSKFKLPKGFLRPGSRRASSLEPTDLPSPSSPGQGGAAIPSPSKGPTPEPSSQQQQQQPAEAGSSDGAGEAPAVLAAAAVAGTEMAGEEAAAVGSPRPAPTQEPAIGSPTLNPASPRELPKRALSADYLVDYPYLIDAEPTPATYLLLCCEDYLRLYSTENVRLGDRATERKAKEEVPLAFAGVFMSTRGPGVATISYDGTLSVCTVPGLDCIYKLRLDHSSVLGFKWPFGPDPALPAAAYTCSADGQLFLAGPSNEIARLLVVQDCVEPLAAVSIYDAAVAEAASAALRAAAAAAAQRGPSGDYTLREQPPEPSGGVESPTSPGDKRSSKGLGRFFNSVKSTTSGVLETAGKHAQSAVQATMQELDRGIRTLTASSDASQQQPRRELPPLQVLFATVVEPLEVDEIDYMTDDDLDAAPVSPSQQPTPGSTEPASGSKASGRAALPLAAVSSALRGAGSGKEKDPKGRQKKERGELIGGTMTPTGARPDLSHMRTASSVREAYGRPRHTERTAAVRSIMEQNKQKLVERGEKLQDLEERSAQMQDDASDFASLAKQLEEHYSNRKWWQL